MGIVTKGSVVGLACLLASAAWAQTPEKEPAIPADQQQMQHEQGMEYQKKEVKPAETKREDMGRVETGKVDRAALRERLDDGQMVRLLGVIHQGEIQLADLALDKSRDPKVRELARHIRDDHVWLDEKTVAVLEEHDLRGKNSDLSRTILRHSRSLRSDLADLDGAAFDRAFLTDMVQAHRDAIAVLDAQSSNARLDDDLRMLIDQTLPSLQAHHDDAQSLLGGERMISSEQRDMRERPAQTGTEKSLEEEREQPTKTGTERDVEQPIREPDDMESDY